MEKRTGRLIPRHKPELRHLLKPTFPLPLASPRIWLGTRSMLMVSRARPTSPLRCQLMQVATIPRLRRRSCHYCTGSGTPMHLWWLVWGLWLSSPCWSSSCSEWSNEELQGGKTQLLQAFLVMISQLEEKKEGKGVISILP